MSLFFKYGEDDLHYGVVQVSCLTQLDVFLHDQAYPAWSEEITHEEFLASDRDEVYNFEGAVRQAHIAKNIALAVARKKRSRAAYKAPTLADVWHTPEV